MAELPTALARAVSGGLPGTCVATPSCRLPTTWDWCSPMRPARRTTPRPAPGQPGPHGIDVYGDPAGWCCGRGWRPPPGPDGYEYTEGLNVGYRGYDAQALTPLFPFGYGLSYTTFGFTNLTVVPQSDRPDRRHGGRHGDQPRWASGQCHAPGLRPVPAGLRGAAPPAQGVRQARAAVPCQPAGLLSPPMGSTAGPPAAGAPTPVTIWCRSDGRRATCRCRHRSRCPPRTADHRELDAIAALRGRLMRRERWWWSRAP